MHVVMESDFQIKKKVQDGHDHKMNNRVRQKEGENRTLHTYLPDFLFL
jgi:hypothetical protein